MTEDPFIGMSTTVPSPMHGDNAQSILPNEDVTVDCSSSPTQVKRISLGLRQLDPLELSAFSLAGFV